MEYEYGVDATIIPLEYYGLIIAGMPKQKAIKKQKDFEFKKYDTDLKEEFTLKVPVPENSELEFYKYEGEFLYALFESEKGRNIIKLNIITKEITNYNDNKIPKLLPSGMEVNNGKVTLYGKVVTNDKYYRLCCIYQFLYVEFQCYFTN